MKKLVLALAVFCLPAGVAFADPAPTTVVVEVGESVTGHRSQQCNISAVLKPKGYCGEIANEKCCKTPVAEEAKYEKRLRGMKFQYTCDQDPCDSASEEGVTDPSCTDPCARFRTQVTTSDPTSIEN